MRNNHGTLTGGITIGNGEFPDPFVCDATVADGTAPLPFPENCSPSPLAAQPFGYQYGYGFNVNTRVHHNMVTGNASIGDALYSGTPSAAGGVSFCSGSDGYLLQGNWVCGNLSFGDSGGVAHVGFTNDGTMRGNWILFNQSQQATLPVNGGGIGVLGASPDRTVIVDGVATECGATTDVDCPPGLPEGTGRNLLIERNLIVGNSAESGSGGGVRLQMVNGVDVPNMPARPGLWNSVTLQNNIIANNVAGWDGGGVSIQDGLAVRLINNTIINNDTTASAGVLFKTIGAPFAATPPPGCNPGSSGNATCPGNINNTSSNQPAGVVTMSHTPNMVAAIGALPNLPLIGTQLICPAGYGYYNLDGSTLNASCVDVSLPLLMNNVLWHNRAFHVEVGNLGTGQQNTQKVVTLVPSLNQTFTGHVCVPGHRQRRPGQRRPGELLGHRRAWRHRADQPQQHRRLPHAPAQLDPHGWRLLRQRQPDRQRPAGHRRLLQRFAAAAGRWRTVRRLQRAGRPCGDNGAIPGVRAEPGGGRADGRRGQQLGQPVLRSVLAEQRVAIYRAEHADDADGRLPPLVGFVAGGQ